MADFNKENGSSIGLFFEQYGPIISAGFAMIFLTFFSKYITHKFEAEDWKSAGLFSAIFGWSAIQTGFAFGVYGFVLGKKDGFVNSIRNTKAMERFLGYIKRANVTGFVLTLSSIPLIVWEPGIKKPHSVEYAIVSMWFSLFCWSFLSFLRLAYNFGHIAGVKDKEFHGA